MRTLRLLLICLTAVFLAGCGEPDIRSKAEAGDPNAQYDLGVMYYSGEGVPKDAAEALKWFRKAADQGHAPAQFDLAHMYAKGEGVPKDEAEAYAWYNLAAVSHDDARKRRDELEKTLTPEQKARAQQRSTELYKEIEARKKAGRK